MQFAVNHTFQGDEDTRVIFASLLKDRGITNPEEMEKFLHPEKPNLALLLEKVAIDRAQLLRSRELLQAAITNGEDICVFGDYDADGVTSTTIMWQSLSKLAKGSKARVMPFIPDRARHGYGLSEAAVNEILDGSAFAETNHPDFRPRLLITVDNGIVANDAVDRLKAAGLQVIITDHHEPGEELPAADAIIHSISTSGAGIAWIACLYFSEEAEFVSEMIDIATIGIVADQIPLTGINRNIVVHGLRMLNHTHNLGLQTLFESAGIASKELTAYEINYVIAPRINAVGRLANPLDALRLLCSNDRSQLESIAATVEKHNTDRQGLTEKAIEEALLLPVEHNLIVAASASFHEGIIGLVAGKLAEKHQRPALVISVGEKVSKGSARSIGDIDITEIMRLHAVHLLGVGGHKLAGGFSIASDKIKIFSDALFEYADKHIDSSALEKKSHIDAAIQLAQTTKTLAGLIKHLEPFGMGNYKPKFLVENLDVLEDRKIGKDGRHRKLVVEQEGVTRDVIWFNGDSPHPVKSIKRMVFTLEINVWRNRESVQLNAQYVETV